MEAVSFSDANFTTVSSSSSLIWLTGRKRNTSPLLQQYRHVLMTASRTDIVRWAAQESSGSCSRSSATTGLTLLLLFGGMCCPLLPAGGLWSILHREVPEHLVIVCLWRGSRLSGYGRPINRSPTCHPLALCQMRPHNAHRQASVAVLARQPERRAGGTSGL